MNEELNKDLIYILECKFNVDVATNYDEIKSYIKDPKFPSRDVEFRNDLASTILNHSITPKIYEDLTDAELETQEEVDEFLINNIWQPLYDGEPIKV